MYGSRNYTKETGGRDQTLDALNRTIEGLEARIEGLIGRTGDAGGNARRSERGAGYGDPLAEIRARQNQLSAGPAHRTGERAEPRHARQQSDFRAAPEQAPHDGLRHLAEAIAEMRRDLKSEIQESLTRELGAIRHEVRDLTAHSRDGGLPDDLNRELAGLSDRIERLGDSGGHIDSLRLELDSMRSMIEGLAREDSVRSLESRWHSLEDQVSAIDMGGVRDDLVKLAYRIDDVREALSSIPASAVPGELENRIVEISRAIEELAGRSEIPADQMRQYFNALGGRLDGITRSVAALQEQQKSLAFDPESFNLLEERINAITKKLGSIEANNLASDMSGRLDQVASRLDRLADEDAVGKLDQRLAHLQSMLENGSGAAGGADHPMLPVLSENIAALSGKLDRVGSHDVSEQLAYRLDDLAARIDSLHQSAPQQSDGVPDAVIGRLEALIGRVEEKASRPVDPLPGFETLEARLAEIAARLDTPPAAAPAAEMHFPAFDDLEARLSDISAKLDRAGTATGFDGDEALRNLEDQIANLSRQIASVPGAEGMERIDSRLGEIEEQLSTNDEYVIEAARQAAEAAIAAYAGRGDLAGSEAAGNMDIITALADDLKALETLSRQSEERNLRAFQGVQETLVKIAERLEMLQSSGRDQDRQPERETVSAQAHEPQAVAAAAPRMPRAETDMFDDLPAEEPVWGPSEQHDTEAGEARVTDPNRSPAEAAAMAAAFAAEGEAEDREETQGGKSFFAGLASRMRSRKGDDADMAEPRFTEEQTPPLEPSLELEEAVANTPLEPGSGAPDINRILQKVRETQARGKDAGEAEGDKSQFLASARRAAMAAAAEAETLSKTGKSGKSGKSGGGSSRRRPILMAVGAVLLVVMSLPLISDLFSSNEAPRVAEAPAITESDPAVSQTANNETALPLAEDETQETAEAADVLPQVRVVDGRDMAMADAGGEANVMDADTGAEMAAEDGAAGDTVTASNEAPAASAEEPAESAVAETEPAPEMDPVQEVEQALMADLDALPEGMMSPELRKAAEEINPVAFYEIGSRFTEGRGTPVDLAKAATWYQRAADLGHAPSQYRLANFYEKGSGVPRNLETAKKWYQLAAEQGNASAMHNLAVLYATAGAAPDFDSAARWFEQAAELGVRDSQVNLAILYARGDGVTRNLEESYKWFAIAANEGDKDAASKRDEVFNALRPEQTERARELVAAWKVAPLNEAANAVDVPASWGGAETATASIDMSKAVRNIQAILNNNGYDAGQPDGIMGAKTVAAIKEFQKAEGMEPSGEVTDELVRKLLERNN